jgi:hypothetical protein
LARDAADFALAEWMLSFGRVHREQCGFDGFLCEAFVPHAVAELEECLVACALWDFDAIVEDYFGLMACAACDVFVEPGRDEWRLVWWRVL